MIRTCARALAVLLALSLLPVATATAEQYYKWVDDEGITHYSSEKPEGQDATSARVHNPASSSQDEALKQLKQQRRKAAQQRKAARERKHKEDEREKNPEQALKKDCKQHRKNLKVLTTKPTVRRKNPETGQMEVLTQEEKEKMIERAKKQLKRCNQLGVGSAKGD